jgi:integrase
MARLPGSLRQRGSNTWQLRFEAGPPDQFGNRRQYSATVRGSRKDAETALIAAIAANNAAERVPVAPERLPPAPEITRPCAPSIGEYMTEWLATTADFSQKTRERYQELNTRQILPLGSVPLDRLMPRQVEAWHLTLRRAGSLQGRPLHPRTIGHAHRVLSRGYTRAVTLELVTRNPLAAVRPPPVPQSEMAILSASQIIELLERLRCSNNVTKQRLYPIAAVALATGLRRGEILATRWRDIDLERRIWCVERNLVETRLGLHFKSPKTSNARRRLEIGREIVAIIERHREEVRERRLVLGLGRIDAEDLVFANSLGEPLAPDTLSRDWANAIRDFPSLPPVGFHALRHTNASLLIAAGLDVVTIAKRLGHGSPATTLKYYAHLFSNLGDAQAAAITDQVMRGIA